MHKAPKVRIAISGGGVAGASLLHTLLPFDHLDVHLFESASRFGEEGVEFGIGRNALAAMNLMEPSVTKCLERAGGFRMKGSALWIGQGGESGEKVFQLNNTTTVVQRANLLRELLVDISPERLHASKSLIEVERQWDGSVLLYFADGSTHECDVLIGADGVHSTVRRMLLRENDPAAVPRKTDWWAATTLNPYDKARESIGSVAVDVEDARECAWVGNGSFMTSNILNRGDTVQFSVISSEKIPMENQQDVADLQSTTMDAGSLEGMYLEKGWMPHLDTAVQELLCDRSTLQATYLWEHLPAHTYAAGPICVTGDAAHATTPFMKSGGGMCMEDTLILSTLLGRTYSPSEAVVALRVYDKIRRPRTQRVAEASHMTGNLLTGKNVNVGLDAEKLEKVLRHRWDFILDFDNREHRDEAIVILDQELRRDADEEAWIPGLTATDPSVPEVLVL